MKLRSAIACMSLLAAGPIANAQDPPASQDAPQQTAPTFRSAAAVIEVDVIVRDGNGRFVDGLTADDFEIFEDGKPQPVQNFYVVSGAPDAGRVSQGAATASTRRHDRMFLFLFDQDHLSVESLNRLKRATEAFIANDMRANDVAGIIVNGRIAGGRLTNSKAELQAALRTVMPYPDSRPARLRALREFPRLDSEFEAARIADGDARLLREVTQRVCTRQPALCNSEGGPEVVEEYLDRKARTYIDETRGFTGNILRTLSSMASGLARFPGRKTLILLTEGFFSEESRPALMQIAAQAARSSVTIYSLDGRGLAGSGGREMVDAASMGGGLSRSMDTAQDGPAILAGETGGYVLRNASNFAGAFTQLADDTSTYYVIGYAPGNPSLDGKFRKIEVKTRVRDVTVRARKGYLATPLPETAAPRGGGAN